MTDAEFDFLRSLLLQRSGLSLTPEKRYLVDSRLLPLCRRHQINGLSDLIARLRTRSAPDLEQAVIEAMTTNETFFFRDKAPFDLLRDKLLPHYAAQPGRKRVSIWCAACSTGQEPYSIAMMLKAMGPALGGLSVEIFGTDLAGGVIERAREGVYTQFEVQRGLPVQMLLKHFKQAGDQWQIAPDLRQMVSFRTLNLLRDFANLGQFDIVFCRNVLIYFDAATKVATLKRLAERIAPGGGLFLGAAETVIGVTDAFMPHPDHRGFYVPVPQSNILPLRRIGGR